MSTLESVGAQYIHGVVWRVTHIVEIGKHGDEQEWDGVKEENDDSRQSTGNRMRMSYGRILLKILPHLSK